MSEIKQWAASKSGAKVNGQMDPEAKNVLERAKAASTKAENYEGDNVSHVKLQQAAIDFNLEALKYIPSSDPMASILRSRAAGHKKAIVILQASIARSQK